MHPDLVKLLALQDVDKEILRLNEEVAALPKRVAAIEAKLAGTKAQLETARAAVKADEAAKKKFDAANLDLQLKISKYRDQMLAVKTNEQYKALQHEIDFAQQEIQSNDDKILETMVDADVKAAQVKAAEAELKAEAAEIEKEKKIAHDKTAEDEKLLSEWNAKRNGLRSGVPDEWVAHYERIAKARKTGLSEARDSKCLTCQMTLRPQVFAEVRAGHKLITCESCSRILYFRVVEKTAEELASLAPKKRVRPKVDAAQAWYYREAYGGHDEVFLCFINSEVNTEGVFAKSQRRIYDTHTGRSPQPNETRSGSYKEAFAEDLGEALRLNGTWKLAELDEYGNELPMIVLDALQRDLALALREARAAKPAPPAEAVSQEVHS
jgi:predicted  nucleic acid-binding Zn-ribbon protein